MSTLTPTDLATVLERLLGRVRAEGAKALTTTREWADTIRAASYGDDKGTNRWETDDTTGLVVPVPNDPTGEQVASPDEVAKMHARLVKLMHQARSVAADIENIYDQASSDPDKHPTIPDENDEDRWCRSCKADRGRNTPVAAHPDGRIRYRGECRWCHDFKADFGRYPTPSLIQKHHNKERITPEMVAKALGHKRSA